MLQKALLRPASSGYTTLPPQNQQQHAAEHAQTTPHSFTGVLVALKNGHYALVKGHGPKGRPMGHMLDHTRNAKKYAEKVVKVTGKLNMSNNTVHVTSIKRT